MLRVLRLGAEKAAGRWGKGDSKEMGREAQGPEDEATGCHLGQSREEAPVLLLPAGGRDGPLRCDWEEAKSERGQRELGAY